MPKYTNNAPSSVPQAWAEFERTCIPPGAPDALKLHLRRAWKAGFTATLQCLKSGRGVHWSSLAETIDLLAAEFDAETDRQAEILNYFGDRK